MRARMKGERQRERLERFRQRLRQQRGDVNRMVDEKFWAIIEEGWVCSWAQRWLIYRFKQLHPKTPFREVKHQRGQYLLELIAEIRANGAATDEDVASKLNALTKVIGYFSGGHIMDLEDGITIECSEWSGRMVARSEAKYGSTTKGIGTTVQ